MKGLATTSIGRMFVCSFVEKNAWSSNSASVNVTRANVPIPDIVQSSRLTAHQCALSVLCWIPLCIRTAGLLIKQSMSVFVQVLPMTNTARDLKSAIEAECTKHVTLNTLAEIGVIKPGDWLLLVTEFGDDNLVCKIRVAVDETQSPPDFYLQDDEADGCQLYSLVSLVSECYDMDDDENDWEYMVRNPLSFICVFKEGQSANATMLDKLCIQQLENMRCPPTAA